MSKLVGKRKLASKSKTVNRGEINSESKLKLANEGKTTY